MPFFDGPEKVAEYLDGQDVRYVAYGSRSEEGELLELSEDDIRYRSPRSRSRWAILAFHRDFHRTVRELSFTRRRLADEPDGVVLDLASRALRLPLLEAPERLDGITPDGRTGGRARIRLGYERGRNDRFLRIVLARREGPAELRASIDGVPLPVARLDASASVFDLAAAQGRLGTVSIDGPPMEVLGVATVERVDEAPKVGPSPQPVAGVLEAGAARWRSGFTPDDWTDGDGVLANLDWPVPQGATELAVELGAGPPGPPEAADVRVLVNGIQLPRIGVRDGTWSFLLPADARPIRRIRILSTTFVPKETGLNDDGRRLGVAVARVRVGASR